MAQDQPTPRELTGLRRRLLNLPRHYKRGMLIVFDFVLLAAILWAVISVRYGGYYRPDTWLAAAALVAAPVLTIAAFSYAGLYRQVTRYLGPHGHTRIIASVVVAGLLWSLLVFMLGQKGIPRSVVISFVAFAAVALTVTRHIFGWVLRSQGIRIPRFDSIKERHAVLVYGAAQAGVTLAKAVVRLPGRDVIGFCDNSPSLWGQYIGGLRVYRPDQLRSIIDRYNVKEVLIAIPSQDRNERRLVMRELESMPVTVNILPSIDDIASGRVSITDLRPLDVQDLLGRDRVPPIGDLLARNTRGKSIMITGAGGSVGSELARQVYGQRPSKLVLFDVSESALYDIDIELRDAAIETGDKPVVVAVLGSVVDQALVNDTIRQHKVETIYHAAAYKHVPLVERNASVGLANNVFGTEVVAEAALAAGVERMVLVSTDKAVRPTNVMGASKRLAELVLQARAALQPTTAFTMVRFGNVLDSSGSVVGRFRRQIKTGGPLTVTHPEIIRYFMSIPEAAELVIQAGAMAKGGEVFVLDMGEPVKIDELARLMIRMSGRDVKDADNPHGDIEIVYTGLRPGEKLYEELLIGANTMSTEHSRIMRSDEPALSAAELDHELGLLRTAMSLRDMETIQAVLLRSVEGYRPDADLRIAETGPAANWIPPTRTLH
ncbi:MAG: polysaccharide biosynthesis protein [Hyphomicrobium sp.]